MKSIVLAKISKRIFAALIDFCLMISLSLILFFTTVFPATFDKDTYVENINKSADIYLSSDLYVSISNQLYLKTQLDYPKTIENFLEYEYKTADSTLKINCMSSLINFYTINLEKFGQNNISIDNFKKDVLKVGSEESNIKSFSIDESGKYELLPINEKDEETCVYFLNKSFADATKFVTADETIINLSNENSKIMLYGVVFIIPILAGISFILYALIPMISPNGESIGKWIFKLGVLTKDGYTLNKAWYLLRWLSLFVFEFILGIATAGGVFLISYVMFVFDKKRRCIHDKLSNSVVIDKAESVWFYNKQEQDEYYIKNNLGN